MNIQKHNSAAWDQAVDEKSEWTRPVSRGVVARAREGNWSVILTPKKKVPREWFEGGVKGKKVLCLAAGGGQQAPVLAAAGAVVTSFDISANQLAQDEFVAARDNLKIKTEWGDAADLSRFADNSFDLIFNPVSNCFMPKVDVLWRECFRVLRKKGVLMTGFMNPVFYMIDHQNEQPEDDLRLKYSLPFSDEKSLSKADKANLLANNQPLEYGHTLEQQIGGQLKAGFVITNFYEDHWTDEATPLNKFTATTMATKSVKF